MNNLQEVSQKIQQLCVEMEKYGVYLSQISQSVAAWRDRLGISLEGTSQTEYIKTICAFQASNQSIRVAIQSLSNATQCGQEWVLSHGSYGYSFESSSATNSYARAEMDANDANVFLREQSNLKRDLVLKFLPSRIDAIDAAYDFCDICPAKMDSEHGSLEFVDSHFCKSAKARYKYYVEGLRENEVLEEIRDNW